jgi:two-component system, OmpR family, sensor histidine kinase CreC
MKEALEGKQYVEHYVQNLTHEIKSPLSAIRGAAELMVEPMPVDQRARFLANIRNETDRIRHIVERMLELAALENRKQLDHSEKVGFDTLVRTVLESKGPMLSKKRLQVQVDVSSNAAVQGDGFLLHQAVSNLIQNAIDFSRSEGQIRVTSKVQGSRLLTCVEDEGAGIPEFALKKVFEKFFSLERPDTREKSTGLGLNFVSEVASLHSGSANLENRPEGGVRATLDLPIGLAKGRCMLA